MSLPLFSAFGVEIELMLVDAHTLTVSPSTDRLLAAVAGEIVSDVEFGDIAWSNELTLHVLEMKTNGPAADLTRLSDLFAANVRHANSLLRDFGLRLMPTAMHPWMDPHRELVLWPHEYNAVYETYHRIFNCKGHGWANLQSVHLNLPFQGDAEFARLHNAIRLLLPLIPALAASSPIADRHITGLLDTRLQVYRTNSQLVPSITGHVVPEPIQSEAEYQTAIYERLYRDIAPHDPEGTLQHPFLNARGAIARFDRGAIEIRVVDAQECPAADLAIVAFQVAVLKALCAERWSPSAEQRQLDTEELSRLLFATVRHGEQARLEHPAFLRQFGISENSITAGELCQHLARELGLLDGPFAPALRTILERGPLARRILGAVQGDVERRLAPVYADLCDCLADNELYVG